MNWIRHVLVDLAVTAAMLLATLGGREWAAWIVYIYTPLMVLLKLGALKVPPVKSAPVPDVFYHIVYAVNVAAPAWFASTGNPQWWWVAAGWVAIWGLSAYAARGRR